MRFLRKYFFVIACGSLIFILSVIDFRSIEINSVSQFHLDKIVHFLIYFSFSIVCAYQVGLYGFLNRLFVFLFPVFYGGIIELFQHYISLARTGCWFDFLFNVLGSFAGILIFFLFSDVKK